VIRTRHDEPSTARSLQAAGLQATRQRQEVLELLSGRARPMTAQQIYEELRRTGADVGLTTIYRTLHLLSDAGLVHVFDQNGEAAYRRCGTTSHHHHLVCHMCGLVIENTGDGVIEQWLNQIPTEDGFRPEWHRLEVYGACGNCLTRDRRKEP
jgi:Fur family transcriptional regulator, ferric uptake regulator